MRISIITVVLNAVDTIEECIHSVLEQGYEDLEYVIIDGGSDDGTVEKIKGLADRFTYWSSKPDLGIAHAMNKGIQHATGDVVGILHADDFLLPGTLDAIAKSFHNVDIIYAQIIERETNGAEYVRHADHTRLPKGMSLNHPATFVRKDVYRKLGGYNQDYQVAMDYEFLLRAFLGGYKFRYIPLPMVVMRAGGLSHTRWKLGLNEVKRAKEIHLGKKGVHYFDYMQQYIRIGVSLWMLKSGFSNAFNAYRILFNRRTRVGQ